MPTPPIGPPPPYDPECAAALAAQPPFPLLTAEEIPTLRAAEFVPGPTDEDLARGGAYTVEERCVPGPAGDPDVGLIICRPAGGRAAVPALYVIHGGGMITGTARESLPAVLDLAGQVGAAVVSVEYRLAPETPHPGPVEDCYAGLLWTVANAATLGIDEERVVVAGSSAGGGLAAAVALLARDRGGPFLAGQLLACPMLDDRNDSASVHQMAGLPTWNRQANEVGWTALLGAAHGGPDVSPYAAPARATDLAGLPPAYIDVGSSDSFRSEDVEYAERIWRAGGLAEVHVWPGGYHGFESSAPNAALTRAAVSARANWLDRLLDR